jgi:hypothetical protein
MDHNDTSRERERREKQQDRDNALQQEIQRTLGQLEGAVKILAAEQAALRRSLDSLLLCLSGAKPFPARPEPLPEDPRGGKTPSVDLQHG